MRLRWVAQNDHGEITPDAEVLIDVGGRWDTYAQRWDGRGEKLVVMGIHPGQLEAARLLVRWMRAKARGERFTIDQKTLYSVLLEGGRRGGKTDLAARLCVTYPVMMPGAYSWLVSETLDKTEELQLKVDGWIPNEWGTYLGAPHYTYTLAHGSAIWLRSAHKPTALKRGKCDVGAINEAQLISEQAFAITRGAVNDTTGLVVLAANPADGPIGYWVDRLHEEATAGKRRTRVFFIDARKNPHVDQEGLEAMREDLDDRTFRREILGEFLPREDVVFYSWSDGRDGNVRPPPAKELKLEITGEFLRRYFGHDFDCYLGMDFQRVPYPCAVRGQIYRDPDDPKAEPLIWLTDETLVEEGDENELSAALIDKGYDPKRTCIIADSSGAFQGIDRDVQVPSFKILRSLGWLHVYRCDDEVKRNPRIEERVKVGNALMLSSSSRRRLFSAPELLHTNRALKEWETRSGAPYRKSEYAHLCDAVTYPLWRFYPRSRPKMPKPSERPQVFPIPRATRGPRLL
jgi:hypothetical protein